MDFIREVKWQFYSSHKTLHNAKVEKDMDSGKKYSSISREKTNKIGFIEGRFSNEQRLQVSTIGIFIEGAWGFDWPITVIHVFDIFANFSSDDHCATHRAHLCLILMRSVSTSWFCHLILKSTVCYSNQCHQP